MYPLGFLFGLGFDTASEVTLLGISATEAAKGIPLWATLVFPALFTAGMLLLDTTDGLLMVGAYGWAFVQPVRKLYYNLAITLVSATVASIVGGIEALTLAGHAFGRRGGVWALVEGVSHDFGRLGYIIVGVFAGLWLLSLLIYRTRLTSAPLASVGAGRAE